MNNSALTPLQPPLSFANGGLFVSRGEGIHPTRVIDTHEIIVVTRDQVHVFEDDREVTLQAGDWVHFRPGLQHGSHVPYTPDCRFLWLHFTVQESAWDWSALPWNGTCSRPDYIADLSRRLLDEHRQQHASAPTNALHRDCLLAAIISALLIAPSQPAASDSLLAERAWQWMRLHFAESIGTADVATGIGGNDDYLGRCYRRQFSHGVVEGIHRIRIDHAKHLLRDTADTQAVIASACGYADPRHFRKWFVRLQGNTPGQWRARHGHVYLNTE